VEPEIRYCTTADGVRIAYSVRGDGPPHVVLGESIVSHVQLEASHPVLGPLFAELARHNTLIRFDQRGSGLSDRVMPSTIDDVDLDMEAVIARVGLGTFSVTALLTSSPGAITFAARHPDRIKRLVLIDGFARQADLLNTPQVRGLLAVAASDFVMATEVIGAISFGTGRDESRDQGAYIRSCIGPEYFANPTRGVLWDASEAATQVRAPTLILRHRGLEYVTDEIVRDLAARISDSRLAIVDGLWADDPVGLAVRVAEFINEGETTQRGRERETPSGTAIILFIDIVDSTALTERMGDASFRTKARDLDVELRRIITGAGGTTIEAKTLGDGVLATFPSASQGIDAALRCAVAGDEQSLPLHLGLHAGDVIREQDNVFGGAVNIAARISALSAPGEVLVSRTVADLARTSAGVTFEDRGKFALKGVADAQRVYAVRKAVEGSPQETA
jgi:class 3 adenylate cyclase